MLPAFLFALVRLPETPTLVPGVKAPDLAVGGWLKQEAPKPQKGRLRIVEFWATWCVPCKAAMPHLSELARKYRDRLDIVGVDVMEPAGITPQHLKRFVAEMGDKMDYRVAYDTAKGTVRDSWLTAAGLNSIPSTFLIDDTNTVLWIGHPDHVAEQVDAAFAGKTDVAANRAAFLVASNWLEGTKAALAKASEAYGAGRKDEAEKLWSETLATWPRAEFMVRKARLDAYPAGSPESEKVLDLMLAGNSVARETAVKFAMTKFVADQPKGSREHGVALVDRALEAKADDTLLYVAAVAYSRLGAYPKAVHAAEAAIAMVDARLANPQYAPLRPLIEENRAKFVKVRDEAAAKLVGNAPV